MINSCFVYILYFQKIKHTVKRNSLILFMTFLDTFCNIYWYIRIICNMTRNSIIYKGENYAIDLCIFYKIYGVIKILIEIYSKYFAYKENAIKCKEHKTIKPDFWCIIIRNINSFKHLYFSYFSFRFRNYQIYVPLKKIVLIGWRCFNCPPFTMIG